LKRTAIIHTTALFLLLGIGFPAGARQEKPDKQDQRAKSAKPDQQEQTRTQRDQQRQQHDSSAKQEQRQQQQDKSNKHEQQIAKQQQDQERRQQQQRRDDSANDRQKAQQQQQHQDREDRSAEQRSPSQTQRQQVAWQGDRARSWQSEHRTWQQRGGYQGYHVPDDRFRTHYGRDHSFRIDSLPVVFIDGRQRFHYGGYWFGLIDPWPEYWSDDWYDRDDVYVDYYHDGYYLYNRRYPGDRISISFYLN
jgi:hypothetical protein